MKYICFHKKSCNIKLSSLLKLSDCGQLYSIGQNYFIFWMQVLIFNAMSEMKPNWSHFWKRIFFILAFSGENMHWNWYNFLTILFLLIISNSEDTFWLSGCCIGRSGETLPLQRQACSVSWRQEAQTLQLEFSAIVKLFWSNYEPLNEEWDCPVAGGAQSHSTWRWFQETQGPVCPGCRPMGSPSGRTSHTHTLELWGLMTWMCTKAA